MQKKFYLLFITAILMTLVACPPAETPVTADPLSADDAIVDTKWQDDYTGWNSYTSTDASWDCQIKVGLVMTASYGVQEGTIYHKKINNTSGYIYYKISNPTAFRYSKKAATDYKDKWYAIYYKDLTENSVQMCDAYPSFETRDASDDDKIADYHCADSLSAAIKTFTVEKKYFAWPTAFTKVSE